MSGPQLGEAGSIRLSVADLFAALVVVLASPVLWRFGEVIHGWYSPDASAYGSLARVLATDGLWDQVPHERVAAVVRAAVDPQGAADALVKLATVGRAPGGGRATPKDDTSVIVVDLNPAALLLQTPRCGGRGSCVVA